MTDMTALITDPNTLQKYTSRRECDAHTALTRAVKEYLEKLVLQWSDGKTLTLMKVIEDFAEPEQIASWPSAAVYTAEPGMYDDDSFSQRTYQLDDGRVLRIASEFTQSVIIDVWATNKTMRMGLASMLEDAFDPVDWMAGFRLMLPHYHGVHATFLKRSHDYQDVGETAEKRRRLVRFELDATIPQIKFVGDVPALDIRIDVEADEDELA